MSSIGSKSPALTSPGVRDHDRRRPVETRERALERAEIHPARRVALELAQVAGADA
jgi:hypothetical protein